MLRYAPDCPRIEARVIEQRRRAHERRYARLQAQNPRLCFCGCGRPLPRYVRFHPECETRIGREHNRQQVPDVPRESRRCRECEGQPWRRDEKGGCIRCGMPYAPERPGPARTLIASSLGLIPT